MIEINKFIPWIPKAILYTTDIKQAMIPSKPWSKINPKGDEFYVLLAYFPSQLSRVE